MLPLRRAAQHWLAGGGGGRLTKAGDRDRGGPSRALTSKSSRRGCCAGWCGPSSRGGESELWRVEPKETPMLNELFRTSRSDGHGHRLPTHQTQHGRMRAGWTAVTGTGRSERAKTTARRGQGPKTDLLGLCIVTVWSNCRDLPNRADPSR